MMKAERWRFFREGVLRRNFEMSNRKEEQTRWCEYEVFLRCCRCCGWRRKVLLSGQAEKGAVYISSQPHFSTSGMLRCALSCSSVGVLGCIYHLPQSRAIYLIANSPSTKRAEQRSRKDLRVRKVAQRCTPESRVYTAPRPSGGKERCELHVPKASGRASAVSLVEIVSCQRWD